MLSLAAPGLCGSLLHGIKDRSGIPGARTEMPERPGMFLRSGSAVSRSGRQSLGTVRRTFCILTRFPGTTLLRRAAGDV
jgi:hypothetical protein